MIDDDAPRERKERWRIKFVAGLIQGINKNDKIMSNEQAETFVIEKTR